MRTRSNNWKQIKANKSHIYISLNRYISYGINVSDNPITVTLNSQCVKYDRKFEKFEKPLQDLHSFL